MQVVRGFRANYWGLFRIQKLLKQFNVPYELSEFICDKISYQGVGMTISPLDDQVENRVVLNLCCTHCHLQ